MTADPLWPVLEAHIKALPGVWRCWVMTSVVLHEDGSVTYCGTCSDCTHDNWYHAHWGGMLSAEEWAKVKQEAKEGAPSP